MKQLGAFDVLTAIQTEVNTMNTHLAELSEAIDDIQPTSEPSPATPTDEPPSPSDEPTESPDDTDNTYNDNKLRGLYISKNFLTLEVENTGRASKECDDLKDISATLGEANKALNLVTEKQLSNSTLDQLKGNNTKLDTTVNCVSEGQIFLNSADKEAVKTVITETEKSGETASNTIDSIVNPPTPTPEDDSGFRSATIALGVLFSLSLIAAVGLAVVAHKRKN